MRGAVAFLGALLLGALAVRGQDPSADARLRQEIERLTALLRERAERARPDERRQLVQRVYDVGDLCAEIWDGRLRPTNVYPSKHRRQEEPDEETEPCRAFEIDNLIELIRMTVEPEIWDMVEGSDIQPKGDRLLLTTLPRVHEGVVRLLAGLRAVARAEVAVDVAAVPVSAEDAALLAGRPRELAAEEAARLGAAPLGAVRARCRDGQRIVQRAGTLVSYLHDYDVEIAQGATIGDPIREELFAGCAAEVRALLDPGAGGAIVHLRLERTALAQPLRTVATEHGPVELPELELTRVNTSLWVPLGRTVVAGGCTIGERPCVFLVTARRVE